MKRLILTLALLFWSVSAEATLYYISPTGSDSNNGTSSATPWLTFSKAYGASGMANSGCGHTLVLLDGVYGDGTGTGKINLISRTCTQGSELTTQALNQRQARINDSGSGHAILVQGGAYLVFDGLTVNSTDNSTGGAGIPFQAVRDANFNYPHHITFKNGLVYNPNRYNNVQAVMLTHTSFSLVEDTEIYTYHRHAVDAKGESNVVRRVYCNPRSGGISGGYGNGVGNADKCVAMYPATNSIVENVMLDRGTANGGALVEINSLGTTTNNKVLGSIAYRPRAGDNSIYIDARSSGGNTWSPTNTLVENVLLYDSDSNGLVAVSAVGTIVRNVTAMSGATTGFTASHVSAGTPPYDITFTNVLALNNATGGFTVNTTQNTYSGNYTNAFGAGTLYSPAVAGGNWSNATTVDPELGNCRAWIPDSSPMKGAGLNGADIGANVLYRYVNGVETTTPLWDPTTGEFPHGALVTGINDVAGDSLQDFHERLNIKTGVGECAFPSTYPGGSEPIDPLPAQFDVGEGATSVSYDHTLPADTDAVGACVVLWDDGQNVGAAANVTVGGNAATFVEGRTTVPGYRRAELWKYVAAQDALSGATTMAASSTGTVDGMVMTTMAFADAASFGTGASNTALSGTPTVTVASTSTETVMDCLATTTAGTVNTSDGDQTINVAESHDSVSLRGVTSSKAGASSGVTTSYVTSNSYWALVAMSAVPQAGANPPDPSPVMTQSAFQFHGLYGTEASPIKKPHSAVAADTNIFTHPTGKFRLRIELTASGNTYPETSVVLFCAENGGAYAKALDSFGSNKFRLIGGGIHPDIPSSNTTTTQQLDSGNFIAGALLRSEPAVHVLSGMTTGKVTELEWALELNAEAGDYVECRVYKDNGTAIDAYDVTPKVTVRAASAGMGF